MFKADYQDPADPFRTPSDDDAVFDEFFRSEPAYLSPLHAAAATGISALDAVPHVHRYELDDAQGLSERERGRLEGLLDASPRWRYEPECDAWFNAARRDRPTGVDEAIERDREDAAALYEVRQILRGHR
ncbi:hypothetical protein WDZ11_00180 (plasmid) [Roseomonas mucosa]|uniref:hypothetical protein n=1 Tax=Roseomonas mucosa TaxID=207340 RepID=UPI0030CBBE7F